MVRFVPQMTFSFLVYFSALTVSVVGGDLHFGVNAVRRGLAALYLITGWGTTAGLLLRYHWRGLCIRHPASKCMATRLSLDSKHENSLFGYFL